MEKRKILIVDDDAENIWLLINDLEEDYDLLTATTGEEALKLASDTQPDLILLDIVMPDMDGYQVFDRLKKDEKTNKIPVIFLTAKSDVEDETKGLDMGAWDYITKPFSTVIVRARIQSVINLKWEMDRRLYLKRQMQESNRLLDEEVKKKTLELEKARELQEISEKRYQLLFEEKEKTQDTQKSILIVDDNPENIHILLNNLDSEYDIFTATTGKQALEIAFSKERIDLILLDIMMPDIDGYEICGRLKARPESWDIPIIFVTAMGQIEDETKGLELGAIDYITKPFSIPIVQARISSAIHLKTEMDKRLELTQKLKNLNETLEKRVKDQTVELQMAYDDLKESEEKYRSIFENALEGIYQLTPEGTFVSASPSMSTMLGYDSPENLIELTTNPEYQIYVNPDDRQKFIQSVLEKNVVKNFNARMRRKDGQIIRSSSSGRAVRDDQGKVIYIEGFCVDISKQKVAEEQLRKAHDDLKEAHDELEIKVQERTQELKQSLNELKQTQNELIRSERLASLSNMVAGVAHEINTPLGIGVTGASFLNDKTLECMEHVEKGSITKPMLEGFLKNFFESSKSILKNLEHAVHIVNSFKQVSSDSITGAPRSIVLKTFIEEVLIGLRQSLKQGNHSINLECPEELEIYSYPDAFFQIFANLVMNSLIHGFENTSDKQIHIKIAKEETIFRIIYRDNGKGIDENIVKQIYDPFFTTKRSSGCTGLGLQIIYNLVTQKLKGEISCDSTPNNGVEFVITLPFLPLANSV